MKTRYFFLIAVLLATASVIQIYGSRQHVAQLESTIAIKDQSGQSVEADLYSLDNYVKNHMLASTQVFLKGSYERAVQAASSRASSADPSVYAKAQASCAGHSDSIAQSRCVSAYIANNAPPQANPQPVQPPDKSAFVKTFMAPGWTPDGAGLTLLAAAVVGITGVYLLIHRKL